MTACIDLPTEQILYESLWTHEVFRRLGFAAKDIFFHASVPLTDAPKEFLGKIQVSVVLRAQCREFVVAVGFPADESDREVIFAKWTALVHRFNAQEGGARLWEDGYEKSAARNDGVMIMAALMERGFVMPRSVS